MSVVGQTKKYLWAAGGETSFLSASNANTVELLLSTEVYDFDADMWTGLEKHNLYLSIKYDFVGLPF